jgi:hypothetical protein
LLRIGQGEGEPGTKHKGKENKQRLLGDRHLNLPLADGSLYIQDRAKLDLHEIHVPSLAAYVKKPESPTRKGGAEMNGVGGFWVQIRPTLTSFFTSVS